jgi:hypothetical protein
MAPQWGFVEDVISLAGGADECASGFMRRQLIYGIMNAGGSDEQGAELALLRARLDALEAEQRASIQKLRDQIATLEMRAKPMVQEVAKVAEPAPAPVPKVRMPVAMPPPLPVEEVKPVGASVPDSPVVDAKEDNFEMRLGRVWLVRFGIVLLLTGLVLLGNFAYRNWIREMPNGVRLLGLFLCAGALIEAGRRLAAKTSLKKPGEVILAGGLSFFYYCTFASHHVSRLKVIDSPVLAAVLLLGAAGLIAGVSWMRNARATAVLGLLLASYSTMLQPVGWLSCVSNVVLSLAGLALMLRPGWAGPGTASMAGTYAAFFGWQIMGAAGGGPRDPSTIWFLVPVWAIFALPGLLDRFRETMGDRARAWFTGGNNAAFFSLFSLLWVARHGWSEYWLVCAVFGGLLLVMGVLGRKRGQSVGGVNIFQGLALASLAMVVKLEGFHLVLGLGFESLALACAFAKFRSRSEFLFSWLAGGAAAVLGVFPRFPLIPGFTASETPLWSGGIAAALIAAASVMMRIGVERCASPLDSVLRAFTALMVFIAGAQGIFGWGLWLDHGLPTPVMVACAAALSAVTLLLSRRLDFPELGYAALGFLVFAVWPGVEARESWVLPLAGAFALAGSWMWHLWERSADAVERQNHSPALHSWCYSAAVALAALGQITRHSGDDWLVNLAWLGAASLGLMAFAIFTKTDRLATCAALLNGLGLLGIFDATAGAASHACLITFSLAMIALLFFFGTTLAGHHRHVSSWIVRGTAFFATCGFWHVFAPEFGGDGLAITGGLLLLIAIWMKIPAMVEVWGFLGLATVWLLAVSSRGWGRIGDDATWRGWAVVVALWGLVVWTSFTTRGKDRTPLAAAGWAASLLGSLWATQMLVWRHDWHAVSVLWTVLGFVLVSGGLGLRLVALRQAGFVLLAMAVGKVFIVDVWDFNTFMRVVAFIVLGGAMILLGLFYNRFAPVLKKLLEKETEHQP